MRDIPAFVEGHPLEEHETRVPRRNRMIVLLIILILLIIFTTPAWPYSRGWGYYPSSGLGLILIILLILLLLRVV